MIEKPDPQKLVVALTPVPPGTRHPRIRSADLFGDATEIVIEHNGRLYLLRKQPLGGLLLTGLGEKAS